jgi:hypothetical protein
MRVRLGLVAFVVCLCAPASAQALKQPLGPEFNISNSSTASAGAVSVAADSHTGRYLVVWANGARLIDRIGTPLTDVLDISGDAVAYNAALGEYIVVQARIGGSPFGFEIAAQRVSASGAKIGGPISVNPAGEPLSPSVACSSRSGTCLVAWGDFGAHARLIGPGGVPAGPEVRLSEGGGQIARTTVRTAVAYSPDADRYLVVWSQQYQLSDYYVSARMFDAGGSAIGTGNPTIEAGREARLSYNSGEREFGVVFTRVDGSGSYITGTRVRENGTVAGAGDIAPGSTDGAGFAFDSHERSYLGSWSNGSGSFLAEDLTQIAPVGFAGGYVVTYNAAADEYLLVRPSCFQSGDLYTVCGRRVGNPPAAADRTGPVLRLTVPRLQRVVRQRGLVLRTRCGEACAVRASARIALPGASRSLALRPATRSLAANATARLKLKTTKRALRKLRRALRTRHRLGARLTVTATDSSRNRTVGKRKIRARR